MGKEREWVRGRPLRWNGWGRVGRGADGKKDGEQWIKMDRQYFLVVYMAKKRLKEIYRN